MSKKIEPAGPETIFTFKLDEVNNAFGISANTLRALADSYGVTPEQIVIRVLTEWAKKEIPDLNLDEPELTTQQKMSLLTNSLLHSKPQQTTSLQKAFNQLLEDQGDRNVSNQLEPPDGGHN
jgi:hypothetical protein